MWQQTSKKQHQRKDGRGELGARMLKHGRQARMRILPQMIARTSHSPCVLRNGKVQCRLCKHLVAKRSLTKLLVSQCTGEDGTSARPQPMRHHLAFNGVQLHLSHELWQHRGYIWCNMCEQYCSEKPIGLLSVCEPPTATGRIVIKRVRNGKTPRAHLQWRQDGLPLFCRPC